MPNFSAQTHLTSSDLNMEFGSLFRHFSRFAERAVAEDRRCRFDFGAGVVRICLSDRKMIIRIDAEDILTLIGIRTMAEVYLSNASRPSPPQIKWRSNVDHLKTRNEMPKLSSL
jgi:hypothetical protein